MDLGMIWDLIAMQPVTNVLIWLSDFFYDSFGLAIIALTIVVNVALFPMTQKQIKSTTAMQGMQPKLAELQKKYAKDKQKLAQEQMKLYKESGLNPTGCLVPMLIQMPVWIALFYSIRVLIGDTPEAFVRLAELLYSSQVIHTALPLDSSFLWFNLAIPDSTMILPLLVGASMWVQQKMSSVKSNDPKQRQQSQMMLWMMPMMFFLFSMQFPSGLALFWAISTAIRIILQYRVSGWGGLRPQAAQAAASSARVIEGEGKVVEGLGGKLIKRLTGGGNAPGKNETDDKKGGSKPAG
jgi:YidC/Oxa1 family membrane protein insertase